MKGLFGISSNRFLFYFFVFLGAFLLRLCYGLCSPFWGADEKQIYLLGLKYYTTGDFPFYGPECRLYAISNPWRIAGHLGRFAFVPIADSRSAFHFAQFVKHFCIVAICLLSIQTDSKAE